MVKLLQQTELKTSIESEPFEVSRCFMQIWKQEMVFCNMLECEDFKMDIQKFRKNCIALSGNKI